MLDSARLLPSSALVPLDVEGREVPSYHVFSALLYREHAHLIVDLVRDRHGGVFLSANVDVVLGWSDATLASLREKLYSLANGLQVDGKRGNVVTTSKRFHQFDLVCARLSNIRSIYVRCCPRVSH